MANYIKTKITGLTEEQYSGYLDKEGTLDFNKVIPRPESLNTESNTENDKAIMVYLTDNANNHYKDIDTESKNILSKYESNTISEDWKSVVWEQIQDLTEDQARIYKEEGERLVNNIREYGHPTWNEWRKEKWGTRWNAISIKESGDGESMLIQTAKSFPEPILKELSNLFPEATIKFMYAREDAGLNTGEGVLQGGEYLEFSNETGFSGTDGMRRYKECWK